jgi:nicotinate-nucleotide--dimethylbenzimidazole phosphoribosyltransferase
LTYPQSRYVESYTHTCSCIPPLDETAMAEAQARQNALTKPPGSLGRLEKLSVQLSGITGQTLPRMDRKAVIVLAGDHGIVAEGVSAYPSEVTAQMVLNFLRGGAAINVLARQAGARVIVADVGVAAELPDHPNLLSRKIAHGTANMARQPAMSREQAVWAVETGIEIVLDEVERGLDLVATGEMGIGNTTPASAITAVYTGLPVEQVTGRGTGVDDAGLARKVDAIERALVLHQPDPHDPLGVLAAVGGFEIGAIAGVCLGAAAHRVPVIVDGYISAAGALIAAALCPAAKLYLIASHLSVERGHGPLWERLGLQPLLDMDLRLGEGTGAVLAMHLVEAACRILAEMATFADAGVSGPAD